MSWIEGPSIRMAEIAVSCWGNIRYGARIIEENDRFIVAQGVCHDLENNVFSNIEVRRRITGRNGKKYGDDMVGVTANAACAIAARNAVFKVVPRAIISDAYEAAMKVADGDEKTFDARRKAALAAFQKLGVTTDEVLKVLGRGGLEDIDTTDLRRMHGLLTAINDGETTADKVFRTKPEEGPSAADALKEKMKQTAASKVTDRPVSSGQKFVPDPAAVEAKARELSEQQEPEAPHIDPDETPADLGPDVSTWQTTVAAAELIARERKIDPEVYDKLVDSYLLSIAMKGKTAKTTREQRLGLIEAIKAM